MGWGWILWWYEQYWTMQLWWWRLLWLCISKEELLCGLLLQMYLILYYIVILQWLLSIFCKLFLDYTCKENADCHGNGFCKARVCNCFSNYEYALDCSLRGCKSIIYHSSVEIVSKIETFSCQYFLINFFSQKCEQSR